LTSYDPTLFAGAAVHYRYGRPPYSPQLEAVLTEELGLDGNGRLLDGGCGPGILTVRLAYLFEHAVGLDPDAAMLAEGRRVADERGITNISWVQALAEDLPAAAPGPYRLATFGSSFHWTDEVRVAEALYDMLEPGGGLALIAHTVKDRPRPPSPGPPPIPHDELEALVKKYLGPKQRAGQGFPILGPGDMANLVAYLFTQRYFDQEGNPGRGARVFESKGCASCHDRRRRETGAPDLTASTERYSPVTLAASLFRHGPAMLETMRRQNAKWPQFTTAEMQDLICFLNSRLMSLTASTRK